MIDDTEGLDSFGEWLRQRRQALDLTQVELSCCAGCSVSALRKIENGQRRPSKQLAELLADCLDISSHKRPPFVQAARGLLRVARLGPPYPKPASRPPTWVPNRRASNIPNPPAPLVGREHELAALARLLGDPQCRLVTLVGVGGIGKTRLALQVAAEQREAFVDGVFFVPLAAARSADFVIPAIAKAAGLDFSGPLDPFEQLINYLRNRSVLLLLDNLEHLLDCVELLARMLASLPALKLLVTSRERLNLQSEWVFEVQGLPVPEQDKIDELETYSSIDLFVRCAQRAWRSFAVAVEERPHLIRICQLVEGLPLAIELAAAWVPVLSCREIAQEIEISLDFLTTSARNMPERHRSIRAAFDPSWRMLSAREQQVFCRLSVFRGGFRREAAKHVAGATLPLLSSLVAKSLVHVGTAGRYDLHELLRQYAAAYLEAEPEAYLVHERHAEYYLEYLHRREGMLTSHRQKDTLNELSAEIDNIRLAWEVATERGQLVHLQQASFALFYYYEIQGAYQEGETVFRRTAETLERLHRAGSAGGTPLEVTLVGTLIDQGYFSYRLGKGAEAHAVLSQCVERARVLGDAEVLRFALRYEGRVHTLFGHLEAAEACLRESLELSRAAGQLWEVAITSGYLGQVACDRGAFDDAERYLKEGLTFSRTLGDARITAFNLIVFAQVVLAQGQSIAAREMAQESLSLTQVTGDRAGMGMALLSLGLVMQAEGEIQEARAMFEDSITLFQEIGDVNNAARAYVQLGHLALMAGDVRAAQRFFSTGATVAYESPSGVLDALAGLAMLYTDLGESFRALELVMHILENPSARGEAQDRAGHLRAELEAQLTRQEIEAIQEGTQTKTLEALVGEFVSQSDH